MIIKDVELAIVCGPTSKLPDTGMPEVAFAGRSNVGKSSLINGIINRKKLARTSSQPGKTQTINFYQVNKEFFLVDLPGYGYAAASAKAREAWGKMIEKYLNTSGNLKAVFLLLDIRHEPSKNDVMMFDWIMKSGFKPIIVATKLDKIKRSQIQKQIKILRTGLHAGKDIQVLPFSALSKQGVEEIRAVIDSFVMPQETEEGADDLPGEAE